MKCQNCGTELQDTTKFCPKCGMKMVKSLVNKEAENNAFPHNISAIWPEWQIVKQLGKGSYGVVYQAIRNDNNVESHAAIKIISIPMDSSEVDSLRSEGLDMDGTRTYFKGIVDDFVSEIRLMESLKGIQNIVSVEDYKVVEKTDGIGWDIYIRMELLTPFNTYICDKTLTETEIIKIGSDICTALEICSQRNIIHRDIKPENIFVNDFGYFKLGDFGIARKLENMTGGLSQKGTFNYMAPEVANSSKYDARVDTYSLGIFLYRLLNNNKLPFLDTEKQLLNPNDRKNAVERRIRGEALPAPCNASPEMVNLILRACAYDPNARFASATEMKQALMSVTNGTYKSVDIGLDKTTSVRPTPASDDATTAVRKAPVTTEKDSQPVVSTFGDAPNKKSKRKKGKFILISVITGIVALVITLLIIFFSSPAYSVFKNMNAENFDSALSDYHEDVEDSFIQQTLLNTLLKDRTSEVLVDYEDGRIDYDSAIAELNALDEMGFDGAKQKIDEITISNNAVNALEKADEYYENGDYENAISEYSKIPETDENYEEAQTKLDKAYENYMSSTIEIASEYNSSGKYTEAIQQVNTAYDILPDSVDTSELDTVKEESLTSYKTQVANEVTELINTSEYMEAFDLIDEAIAIDDNEYFQQLKTSTQETYVKSVTTDVQKHLDNEDYISASRVLENSLTILPDNTDLQELKTQVKKETPIYLLDVCKPYASGQYVEYVNGEIIKMGGNSYTNAFSLENYDYGYAVFNIDSAYSSISFTTGHCDDTDMHDATIKIYCDGILKKEITIGAEDLPQKVTLDITGVNQLKFELATGYAKYGFANVTVK